MDFGKAIRENYLLISAILFVLLLIIYALFYKKGGKTKVGKEDKEDKEDKEAKKNKYLFIQYTFYLIFGVLALYALYLIYVQYFKYSNGTMSGGGGTQYQFTSNDIKISGEDVDIGFLD
jgi:quinol-cytochrome oxidoreductase complex cytochrome b subunit